MVQIFFFWWKFLSSYIDFSFGIFSLIAFVDFMHMTNLIVTMSIEAEVFDRINIYV